MDAVAFLKSSLYQCSTSIQGVCAVCVFRSRQSLNESDIAGSYMSMKVLDQYHGQANGLFGCDEHLAGSMPSRGKLACVKCEKWCKNCCHYL